MRNPKCAIQNMKLINQQHKNRLILACILVLTLIFVQFGDQFLTREVNIARFQEFLTLFFGLIVETTPFVFIGTVVSILVALFFKEEWIVKIVPNNRILSHIVLSFMGILMPVCECGNVPVVRRLMLKGFKLSHAITFLLAAPIISPITIWSTYVAFKDIDPNIVLFRVLAAFFVANFIGILISFKKNEEEFMTEEFYKEVCDHDHEHEHSSKLKRALDIFHSEFISVFRMLVIGSILAALSQTLIPRSIILGIGSNPILAVLAMIILSFVISICANVDAFFARAYVNTFSLGSLMSFMVFGPMIDIKMLMMLRSTFKKELLILLVSLVFVLSFGIGLLFNIIY